MTAIAGQLGAFLLLPAEAEDFGLQRRRRGWRSWLGSLHDDFGSAIQRIPARLAAL